MNKLLKDILIRQTNTRYAAKNKFKAIGWDLSVEEITQNLPQFEREYRANLTYQYNCRLSEDSIAPVTIIKDRLIGELSHHIYGDTEHMLHDLINRLRREDYDDALELAICILKEVKGEHDV